MTEALPPILLVGCGRMGGALLAGWQARGLERVVVVEPATLPSAPGLIHVPAIDGVPGDFEPAAIVLAVKPQMAEAVLPGVAQWAGAAVVLSIMAGKTVSGLRGALGPGVAVVRAMPNTPAAIGQAISVSVAGAGVSEAQRALCDRLLSAAGLVAWVDDEALLDPVTAVSGGGPAYVFLLVEMLEQAAVAEGLPPKLAATMARQTVIGAGALLAASRESAAELRRGVTSPKGTTERALAVLMAEDAWPALMRRAIAAATARSRELAQ